MLVLAVMAVPSASKATAATRVPTHVACVGDSITYGYAASSSAAAYPSVLQTLLGSSVKVSNFGHSGTTMMSVADQPYQNTTEYTGATSFVSGAGTAAVVDVIIMLGTNDSKPYNWMVGNDTRAQQFVTDCGAMVDHFASLSTHPLVFLALPPRAFANTYQIDGAIIHDQILPLLQQVATARGLPIIDLDTPTASHAELFPDGVHPNDTGYALVAQVMHDGLVQALPSGQGGHGGGGGVGGQGGRAGTPGAGGAGGARPGTGGVGMGGAGTGGAATGETGSGGNGTGGASTGGTATGGIGTGGASTESAPASKSGCACSLSNDHRGQYDGLGLPLAAAAFFALRARPRGRGARGPRRQPAGAKERANLGLGGALVVLHAVDQRVAALLQPIAGSRQPAVEHGERFSPPHHSAQGHPEGARVDSHHRVLADGAVQPPSPVVEAPGRLHPVEQRS
ncbi:MAG TPA: GDSL-type esterase/lipase family protein [Polyangia bacterium]|jgi:lysophospholipase L1-like esterase